MKSDYPLITCICVTYNRISLLQKAIACFKAQDYPNKELLVSYPKKDKLTKHILQKSIYKEDIGLSILERSDQMNLGEARNEAIAKSKGDYICTWDDDDWYHNSRLSYQLQQLTTAGNKFSACILNQLFLYDHSTQKAYLSFLYPWENTLMFKKSVLGNNPYTSKDQGEDSNIIDLLDEKKQLYHISSVPFLYIYIYHSGNTWTYSHFKSFIKRSELLTEEWTESIRQLIEQK